MSRCIIIYFVFSFGTLKYVFFKVAILWGWTLSIFVSYHIFQLCKSCVSFQQTELSKISNSQKFFIHLDFWASRYIIRLERQSVSLDNSNKPLTVWTPADCLQMCNCTYIAMNEWMNEWMNELFIYLFSEAIVMRYNLVTPQWERLLMCMHYMFITCQEYTSNMNKASQPSLE